uniref:Uncharacterized protein n=1 Tax=Dunaliella tertiolecta TaxID=3047 RepID=A0A7S3R5S4_DUNTE
MLTIARARKSHKDAMPLQKKEKHTFKHRDAPLPYLAFHSPSSAQQFPMCFTCGLGKRRRHSNSLGTHVKGQALPHFWKAQVIAHCQRQSPDWGLTDHELVPGKCGAAL